MKMLFVCGVCGEIYESEAEAKHCEKGISTPKRYNHAFFTNIRYTQIELR